MWNVPSKKRLDKIPNNTEDVSLLDKLVYLHFFHGGSDWYVTEYNPQTQIFFGYVILNGDKEMAEFGYFSFQELKDISVSGIEIDCEHEKYFPIQKVRDIENLKHLIPIYSD